MKKIVLVIALCASLPVLVFAQQRPGTLRGQVLDGLKDSQASGLTGLVAEALESRRGLLQAVATSSSTAAALYSQACP